MNAMFTKGEFTAADYDEAIAALQDAKKQLLPNADNCAICTDSGHYAGACHHNPLVAAREGVQILINKILHLDNTSYKIVGKSISGEMIDVAMNLLGETDDDEGCTVTGVVDALEQAFEAAISPQLAQEDIRLIPTTPNPEMVMAMFGVWGELPDNKTYEQYHNILKQVIAVAPTMTMEDGKWVEFDMYYVDDSFEEEIKAVHFVSQEKLGQTCMDGGTCHHSCQNECFRKTCCVPLSDSGLDDNWQPKAVAAI